MIWLHRTITPRRVLLVGLATALLSLSAFAETSHVSLTTDAHTIAAHTSSDGQILFTSARHGKQGIYVMNSDGSGQTRLTDGASDDFDPEWSPDGTQVAFSSTRGGNLGEIYVMNADGSRPTRRTRNEGFDILISSRHPAWSPDGTKIAYETGGGLTEPLRRIFTINVGGTGLTGQPMPVGDRLSSYTNPAWSPDGSQIAVSQLGGTLLFAAQVINVMNVDGSGLHDLTGRPATEDQAAWSPDGSKIAFAGYLNSGTWEIYVINADGSNEVRITNNSADDFSPTWSQDGSQIAFTSDRSGRFEIYLAHPDGSNVQQLTQEGGYQPDWVWLR